MVAPSLHNGLASQCPQIWTHGAHRYGVVITLADGALVFKQHRTTLVTSTFDLATIAGNPLSLPLDTPGDSHYGLAICVDGLGKIHIAGNSHSTPLRYVQSTNAEDITVWGAGTYPFGATGSDDHTYHQFAARLDGTLLWSADQEETGASSKGRDRLLFKRGPAATSWSAVIGTGEFATTRTAAEGNPDDGTEANRVYHTGLFVTADDRVHVVGIWRTGDTDANTQKKPWYLYSDDLVTWRNISGTAQTMPITWLNTIAEVTSAPAFSRNVGRGVAIDSSGYPHFICQVEDTTDFVELYWDGAAWTSRAVTSPGSSVAPSIWAVNGRLLTICASGAPIRTRIRDVDGAYSFFLGDAAVVNMTVNPDPIALRDGRLEVSVPNGDTPAVWSYGQGPKWG